jgi:hypothetical protein
MLFDLRGRGRRRVIKVIYVTLAFLMGGGLVFFGIGGDVNGGLFDVFGERGGLSEDDGSKRLRAKVDAALTKVRANPKDATAWAELTRARVQLASSGNRVDPNTGAYTKDGQAKLRLAAASWERFLALKPTQDDESARVASLMVRSYIALEDLTKAARAQEVIAEVRDSAGAYTQLATLAYQAGQIRKGDLAAQQALDKTEPDLREALKGQLESAKASAAGATSTAPSSG